MVYLTLLSKMLICKYKKYRLEIVRTRTIFSIFSYKFWSIFLVFFWYVQSKILCKFMHFCCIIYRKIIIIFLKNAWHFPRVWYNYTCKEVTEMKMVDMVMWMFGFTKKEAKNYIAECDQKTLDEIKNTFRSQAKKSFYND